MKILISPYSNHKYMNAEFKNAKDYPYWQEFIDMLVSNGHEVTQLGVKDEKKFTNVSYLFDVPVEELYRELNNYDLCISVDNFFHHYCWSYGKKCVAIFSRSNPEIFGHIENLNILKDKKYLRPDQFGIWSTCEFIQDAFYTAPELYDMIKKSINNF